LTDSAPPPPGLKVEGKNARFAWERALRADRTLPWHVQGFLHFLASYMDADGKNAYPSVVRLAVESGSSQATVYRLLQEAESAGFVVSERSPGKPSARFPATPNPSHPREGYTDDPPSTPLTDVSGHPSHEREGYTGLPLSPVRETPLTGETQQEQTMKSLGHAAPDPCDQDPEKRGVLNEQPQADRADGPDENLSPKPDPPPRANRRRRTHLKAVS
jgi:Helix-turn-helix domain